MAAENNECPFCGVPDRKADGSDRRARMTLDDKPYWFCRICEKWWHRDVKSEHETDRTDKDNPSTGMRSW